LGEANVLPAVLEADHAQTRLGLLALRQPRTDGARSDGVVVLRPEELQIAAANGSGSPNALVTSVEYYGHDARVELECQHPAGPFCLIARTTGVEAPEVGQHVRCSACAGAHAL
jgi:hypothetical protein